MRAFNLFVFLTATILVLGPSAHRSPVRRRWCAAGQRPLSLRCPGRHHQTRDHLQPRQERVPRGGGLFRNAQRPGAGPCDRRERKPPRRSALAVHRAVEQEVRRLHEREPDPRHLQRLDPGVRSDRLPGHRHHEPAANDLRSAYERRPDVVLHRGQSQHADPGLPGVVVLDRARPGLQHAAGRALPVRLFLGRAGTVGAPASRRHAVPDREPHPVRLGHTDRAGRLGRRRLRLHPEHRGLHRGVVRRQQHPGARIVDGHLGQLPRSRQDELRPRSRQRSLPDLLHPVAPRDVPAVQAARGLQRVGGGVLRGVEREADEPPGQRPRPVHAHPGHLVGLHGVRRGASPVRQHRDLRRHLYLPARHRQLRQR